VSEGGVELVAVGEHGGAVVGGEGGAAVEGGARERGGDRLPAPRGVALVVRVRGREPDRARRFTSRVTEFGV